MSNHLQNIFATDVDEKMQRKFLELFRGLHLSEDDDDSSGGSSSSEEEVSGINQMCPREAFFYSLAPNHLEARMLVQRILVGKTYFYSDRKCS